jgi:hypothetical protein
MRWGGRGARGRSCKDDKRRAKSKDEERTYESKRSYNRRCAHPWGRGSGVGGGSGAVARLRPRIRCRSAAHADEAHEGAVRRGEHEDTRCVAFRAAAAVDAALDGKEGGSDETTSCTCARVRRRVHHLPGLRRTLPLPGWEEVREGPACSGCCTALRRACRTGRGVGGRESARNSAESPWQHRRIEESAALWVGLASACVNRAGRATHLETR